MVIFERIAALWTRLCQVSAPALSAIGGFFCKAADIFMQVWASVVKLRKIFLAIPVVIAALELAQKNMVRLPDTVGLDLQIDGTFAIQITRDLACWGPVLMTLVCLVLMFCSKRVLTPWVVSLITLLIPIAIWVLNVFPS